MLYSLFAFGLLFLEGGGLRCSPVENLDSGELMGVNAIEQISKCGTEGSLSHQKNVADLSTTLCS